jgi:hypothetical protein
MVRTRDVRWYVAAFLLWCVCSSKHILIYNEETLVALSFFLFVYLVYTYAGDSIGASMDSRGQDIAQEMEQSLVTREQALQSLVHVHTSTTHVGASMATLGHTVQHSVACYAQACTDMVRQDVCRGIQQRCAYMHDMSAGQTSRMVQQVAMGIPALVMLEHGVSASGVSSDVIHKALAALSD